MKRMLWCTWVALVAITPGSYAAGEPSPYVTDAEFADLIKQIDETRDTILALTTGMTDEQWNFKQNPDRWSVGECVEHITRAEVSSLETVKQMVASPPDPEWSTRTAGKLEILRQYIPNRGPQGVGGRQAPEEIRPIGKWGRAHAIQEFYKAHGELRAYVETMDRNIKDRTRESSVSVFGWLNAYDWLHLVTLHIVRHSRQMIEVQEDPNYPKSPAPIPQNAAAGKAPSPDISDDELASLIEDFNVSEDTLLGMVSGLTDEQWNFRENPNRWSIAECVEHIVRGENIILGAVKNVMALPPDPQWFTRTEGKQALIRSTTPNRPKGGVGSPFKAPFEVSPTEQWSRERAVREIYTAHGAIRSYLETMPRDIKNRTFENPFPQMGWMNCHDWLLLTAMHIRRHCSQMEEVKQDLNYPRITVAR